ncbi:glutathione S-transferase N-terminal domain-containing protein [Nisaea sp.]|uniref:glutathione S-transferase family protein n=1 Tax=Nisaea sp. TaxID=2024842 RepID=UPI0032668204
MRLLGQPNSINVRKVLWTCVELNLEPNIEHWGGTEDNHATSSPDFRAVNPKGLVPVLIDRDTALSESNTICRYLAARENRTDLLPVALVERATVEVWMDWQQTELNNAWRAAFMGLVRHDRAYSDVVSQQASANAWNEQMSLLDTHLANSGSFVCGDAFTLADIVLALSVNRWEMTPITKPSLSNVAAWMEHLSSRPGFQLHCRNGVP